MAEISSKFGKYRLLNRIGTGGMAEVYRGKLTGEEGFEKQVVIKKLLPNTASNDEMVKYFIDEARLAALLQHENIIHIYDFGELEGSYFLAMEYLSGQNLNDILKRAITKKRPVSTEDILLIALKICEGLDYAHNLKNLNGKPLKLVHRDLSPHNIFITYEGKIKILDFGIAKTEMQSTETKIGIAKGKMAYMSPEQIEAKKIDHRSDIFAIGILLYEMVTRRKMFKGDSTVDLFRQVMSAEFEPPEKINPDLEPGLSDIIRRALAKDPEKRYQTCYEMQTDIEDSIYKLSLRPGPKKLSEYLISLFPDEHSLAHQEITGKETSQDGTGVTSTIAADLNYDDQKTKITDNINQDKYEKNSPSKSSLLIDLKESFSKISERTRSATTRFYAIATSSNRSKTISGLTIILTATLLILISYSFTGLSKKEKEFLQKAEICIQEKRLSTPKNDCATYYLNEVLKTSPESREVSRGFEKMAVKYGDLAEAAIKRIEITKARKYVSEGLKLKPDDKRLMKLKKDLSRSRPDLILRGIGKGLRDALQNKPAP